MIDYIAIIIIGIVIGLAVGFVLGTKHGIIMEANARDLEKAWEELREVRRNA